MPQRNDKHRSDRRLENEKKCFIDLIDANRVKMIVGNETMERKIKLPSFFEYQQYQRYCLFHASCQKDVWRKCDKC